MRARIYQPAKSAMQSGRANSDRFVLEFEPNSAGSVDPLMGWVSGGIDSGQIRLHFSSAAEAASYCRAHGIDFELAESAPVSRKPKSYAENFSANRKIPWSH